MRLFKLIHLLFLLTVASSLYAGDLMRVDRIIEHNGYKGVWVDNVDPERSEQLIKTYSTGFNDVILINGKNYRESEKLFIPFSEDYLEYLKTRESAAADSENDFVWPIENFDRITSTFGRRWSAFHEGIDIPAGRGVPIVAVSNGRVTVARFLDNYGNTVHLEHRGNLYTRYCHASQILVKEGEIVKKGQVIAYVGSTGNSTGNHLHFEIRYNDFPLNPLDFLPFNPNVKKSQYSKAIE